MTSYTAHAEWDTTGWWVITIPEVPGAFSQSRRLDQVEENAREVIELMTDKAPDEITVEWSVPGAIGEEAAHVADLRERAEDAVDAAHVATQRAVPKLHAAGLSYRDIGWVAGISHQRAQQIDKERGTVSYEKVRAKLGL